MIITSSQSKETDAEKRFVTWLVTQPNPHGSLYLERVAWQYARYLRTQPPKLNISMKQEDRNVFICKSFEAFECLYKEFLSAPNFKDVNLQGHQSFSAGLAAYRRYVKYIEYNGELKMSDTPSLNAKEAKPNNPAMTAAIPDELIEVLNHSYSTGFRFETTYINLLSNASGVEIDEKIQSALKRLMFKRDDGIYFLLDTVADAATRKDIVDLADSYLEEYGCFEIPEFYKLYVDKVNSACIRNADDFESFYEQIGKSGVRCVRAPQIGNRIARYSNGNLWGTFKEVAAKIVSVISEEYYGSCNEDDLHTKFCAFSTDLLGKIIKQYAAEELIRVEINDSVCYQTYDALGLPENFSDMLAETLERLADIGLDPSRDVLHTTISLKIGVNFMAEFNLPDWDTFQRLIAAFYKAQPHREWKYYVFGEVTI